MHRLWNILLHKESLQTVSPKCIPVVIDEKKINQFTLSPLSIPQLSISSLYKLQGVSY